MNSEKFLPIGTVCSIKGNDALVMITGYFSMEYHNQIKIYDYRGTSYPIGNLDNSSFSFNHNDISDIKYLGFKNESFNALNTQLLTQSVTSIEIKEDSLFKNIEFDENGVVTFAELKNEFKQKDIVSLNNDESYVKNPFVSTIEISKNEEDDDDTENWPIFSDIQFDENGVVISASLIKKDKE